MEPTHDQRLAMIIPYRDRPEQLEQFLSHMTGCLTGKIAEFTIWVVEQAPGKDFNRGMLANIGFLEAKPSCDYICIHDVDILPMVDTIDYSWPETPRHLYGPEHSLGAIALFNNREFEAINGFSNSYWGWGREDVDLTKRVEIKGLEVDRSTFLPRGAPEFHEMEPDTLTRMKTERRKVRTGWIDVWNRNYNVYRKLWRTTDPMDRDGLSTCRYKILSSEADPATHVHHLLARIRKGRLWW